MTQPSSSLRLYTSPQLPFRHTHTHIRTNAVDPRRPTAQPGLPAQSAEATVPPTGLSTLFSLPEILLPCAPPSLRSSRLLFWASSRWISSVSSSGQPSWASYKVVSIPCPELSVLLSLSLSRVPSLSLGLPGRGQPCVQTPPCDGCSEDIFRMNE